MDEYKIHRNQKPPTDEQINRHKDFAKLMQSHSKVHRYRDATKPLYKQYGFLSFMILAGVIVLLLCIEYRPEQTPVQDKDSITVKPEANYPKQKN